MKVIFFYFQVVQQCGRGRTAPVRSNQPEEELTEEEDDDEQEQDAEDSQQLPFEILGVWESGSSRSRNTRQESIEIQFKECEQYTRPENLLELCITRVLDIVLADRPPPLRIGMSVQPPGWERAFHVPPRDPQQNTTAALAAALESFADQSGDGMDLFSENIRFSVCAVWPLPVGEANVAGACAQNEMEARADGAIRCRSYVPVINPGDNYCLARALIFGLEDHRIQRAGGTHAQFRAFCDSQRGALGRQNASELLEAAGVSLTLERYGVRELKRLQRSIDAQLGEQQIRIVLLERQRASSVVWKAPLRAVFNLFIVVDNGHYGYIQKPEQLFHAKAFCAECEQCVDRRSHPHGCRAACMQCLRFNGLQFPCQHGANDPPAGHRCDDCGFIFVNRDCFDSHRSVVDVIPAAAQGGRADRRRGRPHRSLCQERRHCPQCNVIVWARAGAHQCRQRFQQQQQQQPPNFQQSIQPGNDNAPHQQPNLRCVKCGGHHKTGDTPCFIQPSQYPRQFQRQPQGPPPPTDNNINGEAVDHEQDEPAVTDEEEEEEEEEGVDDELEDPPGSRVAARKKKQQKPLRFIFWDAECSQEEEQQQQQQLPMRLKHVPLLICADVICERCLADGVRLESEPMRRAPDCCCGVPWRGGNRGRWAMRIGGDAFDDGGGLPQIADGQLPPDGLNPRRLCFFADGASTAVVKFAEFLLHTGPLNTCSLLLAHNGGKYDAHILLEEFHRRGIHPRKLLTNGLRIYSMHHGGRNQRKLVCKDTLNFFGCALSALPATFGLEGVVDKPFFPYAYIARENMDVELEGLPPLQAYEPDRMMEDKRAQFLRWYDEQQRREPAPRFLLRRELLRYCSNDVRILREASLRFRATVGRLTGGMEPFMAASTIAGLALAVFRQCHLQRNLMRHTPEGGFLRGRRASAASRRFFAFLEHRRPGWAPIRTAQWAIGEASVEDDGYRLDGLVYRHPPLRPIAIEFNGCFYHGCPRCFPRRQMILAGGQTAELLYARTQQRAWELVERHGMQLHTVWECEFNDALRKSVALRREYTAVTRWVPEPMDLRKHALYGGRVEPFCLNARCPEGWEISLYDIVSQYPDVMKNCRFPLGLPRVLTREHLMGAEAECSRLPWCRPADNPYRGFVLCRVLPPTAEQLGEGRLPLLPYRLQRGSLTFPLCRCCAERGHWRRVCRHNDDQKSWVSAYTHVELNVALEIGYTVVDLWEVWDYADWSTCPQGGGGADGATGSLFGAYIDTFMKLKAEASGWPADCQTTEQRAAFIRNYHEREGILLDPEQMESNPSLRKIAKSLINSLWGKLAQRAERDEVRYTQTPREFHELIADPSHEVVCFTHINEHLDRCVVRKRGPFVRAPLTNNLAVACFVTSYGRLSLYRRMEEVRQLGGRPMYCDTDSLMYIAPCGAPPPTSAGDALGQMKKELPDRRITDFFAGGPKNYGYRHVDARTGADARAERKIRGLKLNYEASQLLTFERTRQLVLNHFGDRPLDEAPDEWSIAVPYTRFERNKRSHIFTRRGEKVYRPVYTKGLILRPEEEEEEEQNEDGREQQQQQEQEQCPTIWTRPFGWFRAGDGNIDEEEQGDFNEEDETDQ